MRNLLPLFLVALVLSAPRSFGGEAVTGKQDAEKAKAQAGNSGEEKEITKSSRKEESQTKSSELQELAPSDGFPEGLSPAVRQRLLELLEKQKRDMGHVSVFLRITHYDLSSNGNAAAQLQLDAITRSRRNSTSLTGRSRRGPITGLSGIGTHQVPNSSVSGTVGGSQERQNRSSANQKSIMTTVGEPSHISILTRTAEVWDSRVIIPAPRRRGKGEDQLRGKGAGKSESRLIENVVGTGFRVLVKAATPDAILMELCPYYHVKVEGSRRRTKRIYLEELQDTVLTLPGQPVTLSAYGNGRDNRFSSIFSNVKDGGSRSFKTVVQADIHIQRPGAPPDLP